VPESKLVERTDIQCALLPISIGGEKTFTFEDIARTTILRKWTENVSTEVDPHQAPSPVVEKEAACN
jgi:hypothetical protein